MTRRAFISMIIKVTGNVNADAGIGTRIPLKKIVTWDQRIKPFVSARNLRRCIRERLAEKGFNIDPLHLVKAGEREILTDIGDPITYIDDDLFGYLVPGEMIKRASPIKTSHLISLKHTEINVEFAARFPRDFLQEYAKGYPSPFEVEVAEWLGKLDVIVSERIGRFYVDELREEIRKKALKEKSLIEKTPNKVYELPPDKRKKRLRTFLEIILWEGWQFSRSAHNVSMPDFHYAIVVLSDKYIPLGGYVDITSEGKIDIDKVNKMLGLYGQLVNKSYLADYKDGKLIDLKSQEKKALDLNNTSMNTLIEEIINYIVYT